MYLKHRNIKAEEIIVRPACHFWELCKVERFGIILKYVLSCQCVISQERVTSTYHISGWCLTICRSGRCCLPWCISDSAVARIITIIRWLGIMISCGLVESDRIISLLSFLVLVRDLSLDGLRFCNRSLLLARLRRPLIRLVLGRVRFGQSQRRLMQTTSRNYWSVSRWEVASRCAYVRDCSLPQLWELYPQETRMLSRKRVGERWWVSLPWIQLDLS